MSLPPHTIQPLHATSVGDPASVRQRMIVLHGIYGRGRNWQAIARQVAAARPEWGSLLVDLRLHGDSPALTPPHTLQAAADDVRRLVEAGASQTDPRQTDPCQTDTAQAGTGEAGTSNSAAPVRAVLGHSFGGKVALAIAAAPFETLRQVWVVDSAPGTQTPSGSAWDMIGHVRSLPSSFASRADAIAGLERLGWPVGVASWMATNLQYAEQAPHPNPLPARGERESSAGAFHWRLDFDAMEALLHSYFATDLWHVIETPSSQLEIHVVKAQDSSTLGDAACARIERAAAAHGRVHLHRVAGGHWLHTENPRAIVDLLTQALPVR